VTSSLGNTRTVHSVLRAQAQRDPDGAAIWCGKSRTSFRELDERSNRVAAALRAEGIAPGDRVAFLGKNSEQYLEMFYGCAKAGAVLLSINIRLTPTEVRFILQDSGSRLFVTDTWTLATAEEAAQGTEADRIRVIDGGGEHDYAAWRDAQSSDDVDAGMSAEDPVIQIYTSGTTGFPKGAVISHRTPLRMLDLAHQVKHQPLRWAEGESILCPIPNFHVGGSLFPFWVTMQGATIILMPDFTVDAVLDALDTHSAAAFVAVPEMLQMILAHPRVREIDCSRLRYIYYGAAPITQALLKQCMDVFGCRFTQTYGMTEHTVFFLLGPDDHGVDKAERMLSVGPRNPGIDAEVLDPDGNVLPAGTVGEICLRSPAMMLGYWRGDGTVDPAVDADGWFHTGDAGYFDEDGYLFLKDRIKDMLISGGENVYPAEVERVLAEHPDVVEAAVVGLKDPKWGEVPKAYVVSRGDLDAPTLQAFAGGQLARYKVPKQIEFIDALPRNPSGKVLRRELRERAQHSAAQGTAPRHEGDTT
jgi:acyl-CoA synthetase (AMP-forming)/AMP-acid ligase II